MNLEQKISVNKAVSIHTIHKPGIRSDFFNETIDSSGSVRKEYHDFFSRLMKLTPAEIESKRKESDLFFRRLGITFSVYNESKSDSERLIPFDMIPRILSWGEWQKISEGLRQRVCALNAFIHDIYHQKEILKAGRIPEEIVFYNNQYRVEMNALDVPRDIYIHIAGIDLVRTGENEFFVLEDNLRTPSGVSYMLANRRIMMRLYPDLFAQQAIAPIEHYPGLLLETLRSVAPEGVRDPQAVVLTPGPFNSAYFEHIFLAQQMGIEAVQAQDLFVRGNRVYMRTTEGEIPVDVIYRRVDDDFLDPLTFRPESVLGVPGLLPVYRSGGVNIVNAVGTGIADDKAVYSYVPEMIRFYLGEEPLLNNVPTFQARNPDDRDYILSRLHELVVKEVHGSGGYGMLVGPSSTPDEIELFRRKILARPKNYIAQPTLALSTSPVFVENGIAPRHVDLRPFILSGRKIQIVPGGLTRVALREGSLVVNSSQGGGTKDTWVLEG